MSALQTGITNETAHPCASYLAQQTPGVFTKVWADGRQQQRLSLYELKDELSVHALDGQLAILVFGRLSTHKQKLRFLLLPCLSLQES